MKYQHADAVTEEERRDFILMRRGDFHYLGGRQGGVQRGLENDKLSGAADVPVGIQIDGDLLEYKEGASSKGPFRQVTMEGGVYYFVSEKFY